MAITISNQDSPLIMTPDLRKHIDSEQAKHRQMENAIAQLFVAWAAVESDLANLLAIIVRPKYKSPLWAIYFSPSGMDGRLRLVDAAFVDVFSSVKEAGDLVAKWSTINNALGRLKNTRNAVAHGTMSVVANKLDSYVTITPPAYDLRRLKIPKQKNQKLGLVARDLRDHTQAVWRQSSAIQSLSGDIAAIWAGDPSGSWPDKSAPPPGGRPSSVPRKASQRPPRRKAQPRP